jgi:hypothetical protein
MKLVVSVLCVCALGCTTAPTGDTVHYAGYVGDRSSTALNEIVVSVPSGGPGTKTYNNLHVTLAAIINVRQVTSQSDYDVERIVRRMEPRTSARVVDIVLASGPVAPSQLSELRGRVVAAAQAEFDAAYAKWEHAPEFDVALVVTSLYLTDGSVGRAATGGRRWD